MLSYLRVALNPDNRADIKRIINVPPRGIGKTTLAKIFAVQEEGLPLGMRAKIAAFHDILAAVREKSDERKSVRDNKIHHHRKRYGRNIEARHGRR